MMSNLPESDGSDVLRIEVEQRGDSVIVKLSGSANMDVCNTLQDRLYEVIDLPARQLIVDMSELDFMSSVGLGAIIAAHLRGRHRNCELKLVSPKPDILELLDLTKLTRLFDVFKSVDEAVAI
jgi:anti-sigma B factor antagonist